MAISEGVKHVFRDKTIFVLSPQSWRHIKLSKHHYASELAKNNTVVFVGPPVTGRSFSCRKEYNSKKLIILSYSLPLPSWLKFKWPLLYKFVLRSRLKHILLKSFGHADYCIDFGCYQQFDDVGFVLADYKIFFPVDDFAVLRPDSRGCDIVFTVSENIQRKFPAGTAHFINHGLSYEFVEGYKRFPFTSKSALETRVKVAYAGNLFLRFLDTEILMSIIARFENVDFHFFGSTDFSPEVRWQWEWNEFLRTRKNVFLRGAVSTVELVKEYSDMDAFLLCYKPDYKDYHAENSHKVLEYLSTGKVLVSTYLSIYKNSSLFVMSAQDRNQDLIDLFAMVVERLSDFNDETQMFLRRDFALQNTYAKQIERMLKICNEPLKNIDDLAINAKTR